MKKKFLSVLLTLTMVLAMVPATAMAVDNTGKSQITSVNFKANPELANTGAGINDAVNNTMWVDFDKKLVGAGYWLEVTKGDKADYLAATEDSDFTGDLKDGWSHSAWSFENGNQIKNLKAEAGEYTVSLYSFGAAAGKDVALTKAYRDEVITNEIDQLIGEAKKITLVNVTFDPGDGAFDNEVTTAEDAYYTVDGKKISFLAAVGDTIVDLEVPVPTNGDKKFAGWYADPENGEEAEAIAAGTDGALTLKAKWEEKTATKEEITDTTIALTAPVKGVAAQTEIDTAAKGYTTAISWEPAPTDGKFAADTEYTATITLTADQAHKFAANGAIIVTGQTVTPVDGAAEGTLKGTVTFPKTAAEDKPGTTYKLPVPEKAILSDRSGTLTAEQICENYDVTTGTAADGVIPVTIKADNLRKHENGSGDKGFYIGFALAAPDQEATKVKYVFAADKAGIETVAEQDIELEINAKHEKGVAFYSDLSNLATAKKFVKIQWLDKDGNVITIDGADTFVYKMDFANVTKFEAEVAVAPPAVEVKPAPVISDTENKKVADAAHTAISTAISDESAPKMVADEALQTAANDTKVVEVAATVDPADQVEALKEATNDDTIDEAAVKIVVQPYLDIQVKDATTETVGDKTEKTLTVQITPMYRVVATTADVDNDEEVKIDAGAQTNAVVVDGKGGKLDSVGKTEPVEVKIPLGAGFVEDGTIYVDHYKDDGTYVATYEGTVVSNVLTFTNPDGFSVFKAKTTDDSEVKIGDVRYNKLKDAVVAVENGETITLLKSPATDTITVGKEIEFTVNGLTNEIKLDNVTIKADTGFVLTKDDNTEGQIKYTFTTEAPRFTVTVNGSKAGEHDGHGSYIEGATVTIYAGENTSREYFDGWTTNDAGVTFANAKSAETTFTMPDHAVTVTANWGKISSGNNNGGSGHGGSHSLDEIKGGRYDNLPKEDDKPVIGSDNDPSNPFVDVSTSDPYYDAIMEVYKRGWMVGISDNTFASAGTLTRGMAAQILWNKAGNPAPANVSPFLDVTSDKWYATAIAWAYEQGLVLGYDGTTFGPDDFVTTEQFTIMLDKLAGNTPAPYVGGAANATRGWVANEIVK